jgi:hypothetical protein
VERVTEIAAPCDLNHGARRYLPALPLQDITAVPASFLHPLHAPLLRCRPERVGGRTPVISVTEAGDLCHRFHSGNV